MNSVSVLIELFARDEGTPLMILRDAFRLAGVVERVAIAWAVSNLVTRHLTAITHIVRRQIVRTTLTVAAMTTTASAHAVSAVTAARVVPGAAHIGRTTCCRLVMATIEVSSLVLRISHSRTSCHAIRASLPHHIATLAPAVHSTVAMATHVTAMAA